MSTDIIHFLSKKLQYYKGDYDTFVNVRTELAKNQRRAYEASAAKKAHMQEFIDKFRSNAKRASLVQSRIKVKRNKEDEFRFAHRTPHCCAKGVRHKPPEMSAGTQLRRFFIVLLASFLL